MTYGKAWHLLNAQMKRSLKNYAEEAHVSKTKGDAEGYHKWDERANALQTLKDWFDILDREITNTPKEDR